MSVYSRKYGRYFKNRAELQRHAFWDYRTKPIFSWFGLRDCLYSKEYKEEHGLIRPKGTADEIIWGCVLAAIAFLLLRSCAH